MKSLWLMIALTGAVTAQAAPVRPFPKPLTCKETVARPGTCAILQLGAPAATVESTDLALTDVSDSRCPLDVDCVWAGYVTAELLVENAQAGVREQAITLSLDPRNPGANVWIDDASGLTVILQDVSRGTATEGPIWQRRQVKVRVGYDLAQPNPNM